MLTATRHTVGAFRYASPDLKADREIILIALQQTAGALRYVPHELKTEREILLAALASKRFPFSNVVEFLENCGIPDTFYDDIDVVKAARKRFPSVHIQDRTNSCPKMLPFRNVNVGKIASLTFIVAIIFVAWMCADVPNHRSGFRFFLRYLSW